MGDFRKKITCRLISREKILAWKYYTWRKKIPTLKKLSFVAYDSGKKSYSAAVVCQEKKFYHQRVWGKNSFPAKSPIPPTEPHPLSINVKWSAIPSVPSVPLLLGSSVPSLPNVPLFHAPLVSYPASIACERQTFLLALIPLEGRSQRR